jgi:hypothetical protein
MTADTLPHQRRTTADRTAKFDYIHFVIVKWKAQYKALLLAISMTSYKHLLAAAKSHCHKLIAGVAEVMILVQ